jgi:2-desacetyl-2-hydroxyethyl bacteriochlorophyllide A dehydrogenase
MFPEKQRVVLESFELKAPEAGHVLVRTRYSLMSTGTENIVYNRLFDPGTHWDKWVKYPFHPGYTSVGTVEEVGEGATLRPGQRVAFRKSHASHAIVRDTDCLPIPDELPLEEAVWFALAKITFHGAQAARYTLGATVLIIGAGPIGQMSTRWARAAGAASIGVVDSVPNRMELARAGGATATIAVSVADAKPEVEKAFAATGGRPRVVIDSTGNPVVFAAALGLAADRGTVVVMGDTGQPALQTLTPDVVLRGLTIVGVHDGHNTAEWNNQTITRLFFQLATSGRFPLQGLISHRFGPEECAEAYETANRDRGATMGILFDWEKGS